MITNHHVRKVLQAVCRERGIAGRNGMYVPKPTVSMLTMQALGATPTTWEMLQAQVNAAMQRGIDRGWLKLKRGRSGGIRLRRRK